MASEVLQLKVSDSTVQSAIFRVSEALLPAYQELKKAVPEQPALNIDETGWKENGKRQWVWLFCSKLIALFVISKSRGCQVLEEVLGKNFLGALTSDFYSAYRKYASPKQQFLFSQRFANKTDAHRIQRRILKHWNSTFRFLEQLLLYEPTNNHAERTLRPIVRLRRISQGSRGKAGSDWTQRAASVLATCRLQKKSVWQFFFQVVSAKTIRGINSFSNIGRVNGKVIFFENHRRKRPEIPGIYEGLKGYNISLLEAN